MPVTHSCGKPLSRPATTGAISSSVAAKTSPPPCSIIRVVGLPKRVPPTSETTTARASTTATAEPAPRRTGVIGREVANSTPPTERLVTASAASVAGEPISGMTKNGSTKVPTIEPAVLTASSVPVADPSAPDASPSSAAVAGKVSPITTVGGSTTTAADQANPRRDATKSAEEPLNGDGGEASTAAPTMTSTAVSSWATAISPITDRTRGRIQPSSTAPAAIPTRNRARMIVNTYVEPPVPAPRSRFHTTW